MKKQTKAWCKANLGYEDIFIERGDYGISILSRAKWIGICRLFGLNPRTTECISIPIKNLTVLYFGHEGEGLVRK